MLNIGIHLDDCPMVNDGLRVLPGSHKQSTFQLLLRKRQHFDHQPDLREVGMDIVAGDLTIHYGSLWLENSPVEEICTSLLLLESTYPSTNIPARLFTIILLNTFKNRHSLTAKPDSFTLRREQV